ncbi:hypothetical protein Taro_016735 [Colocasia esculenta]|uniref:Uncharacterized protein n=1 Tax=Colocasia esculenta TaxID=4460 RepID=A0A843UR35_COLES|nr:hypothetical protein [Colocasia esculenta]
MGPQLGQATVLCAFLWFSVAALSRSSREAEAGARLASRGSGWCVLLLAASGGGLVVVVVTVFPHDVFKVPAALADEGLVISTGPRSRGSPPYSLQLGARCRGSSVSDGLRRRLWRHVLSAAVRASVVSSCT